MTRTAGLRQVRQEMGTLTVVKWRRSPGVWWIACTDALIQHMLRLFCWVPLKVPRGGDGGSASALGCWDCDGWGDGAGLPALRRQRGGGNAPSIRKQLFTWNF
jgi:hypothetical protein